jgi:hypothetical protein
LRQHKTNTSRVREGVQHGQNGIPPDRRRDDDGQPVGHGRFWGFRHRIEVPPQQVPADEKVTPVADEIRAVGGAAVTLAVSPELKPAEEHHARLCAAVIAARRYNPLGLVYTLYG